MMFVRPWASCQIQKIVGCACAGDAGNAFLSTTSKETTSYWTRHASWHVRHARAVMHVRIDNPRCREKRSRHSRRMRNPCFYVSDKRPITRPSKRTGTSGLYHILLWCIYVWIYIYIYFVMFYQPKTSAWNWISIQIIMERQALHWKDWLANLGTHSTLTSTTTHTLFCFWRRR